MRFIQYRSIDNNVYHFDFSGFEVDESLLPTGRHARDALSPDDRIRFADELRGAADRWQRGAAPQPEPETNGRRIIYDALAPGEPLFIGQVVERTGLPYNRVKFSLFDMHRAGKIEKVGRGKYRKLVPQDGQLSDQL